MLTISEKPWPFPGPWKIAPHHGDLCWGSNLESQHYPSVVPRRRRNPSNRRVENSENCRQRVGEISRSLEQIKVQKSAVKVAAKMNNFWENVQIMFSLLSIVHLNFFLICLSISFVFRLNLKRRYSDSTLLTAWPWWMLCDTSLLQILNIDLGHILIAEISAYRSTCTRRCVEMILTCSKRHAMMKHAYCRKIEVDCLPVFFRSSTVFCLGLTVPILLFILAGWLA